MNLLEILTFAAVLWLGIFLFERDPENGGMRNAAFGMLAYAFALMLQLSGALPGAPDGVHRLFWASLVFPPYFWSSAVIHLAGDEFEPRTSMLAIWRIGIVAVALLAVALIIPSPFWPAALSNPPNTALAALALVSLLPLLTLICGARAIRSRKPGLDGLVVLAIATCFFTLGIGLFFFRLPWMPAGWIYLALALDFELLGLAVIRFDVFDTGERVLPDFLRSFAYGALLALLFAGQVAVVIALSTGYTFAMSLVLHLTVAMAFTLAVYADPVQGFLERLVNRGALENPARSSALRAEARAQSRLNTALDPANLDSERFFRLTRRALSNFGDLHKLAASPLTRLALVDEQLANDRQESATLLRARVLKSILADSVLRLKPDLNSDFGESDEWRFFNALYFPYVLGLRPYSRKAFHEDLEPASRKALAWFRSQVPERTLYNWQNTAARLVAKDLFERSANLHRQRTSKAGMNAPA